MGLAGRMAPLILIVLVAVSGCSGVARLVAPPAAKSAPQPPADGQGGPTVVSPPGQVGVVGLSPADFLRAYDLPTQGEPVRFGVTVPASWNAPLGAYPTGLFWTVANVYSRDAGLDLSLLKGQTVTVWRYRLDGGLPGVGESSRYTYPSNVVLLVRDDKVLGAWLAFNLYSIGPSVKRRNFEAITGLPFERWVEQIGFFADAGPNADLARMGPGEVLDAFFQAINKGDKLRANACLAPQQLLDSLTVNLAQGTEPRLYNPGFGNNNAIVENILHGRLLSYRMVDPEHPGTELKELGERTRVELAAEVEIQYRLKEFNSPTGRTLRFAVMEKGAGGWKLNGLGTGP